MLIRVTIGQGGDNTSTHFGAERMPPEMLDAEIVTITTVQDSISATISLPFPLLASLIGGVMSERDKRKPGLAVPGLVGFDRSN